MSDQSPQRDSIDDTLDWLEARKEICLQRAMKTTGGQRDGWIEDASIFGHAISLIRREYRPKRSTPIYPQHGGPQDWPGEENVP
jgi:hypothetical protein